MLNFLYGRSKFVYKLHPVHTLDSVFLRKSILEALDKLEKAGIIVKGLIVDNNRVNQNCFTELADDRKKPYVMTRNEKKLFLFKDPTHILKCLRNNWITEKTKDMKKKFLEFNKQ